MFQSERFIEDYICEHQEEFINTLKSQIYGEDTDIKFIGRQVRLGEENIIDLLYYYDGVEPNSNNILVTDRHYIIIELKNRRLEPKDLAQIGRYIGVLKPKLAGYNKEQFKIHCEGILAGTEISRDLAEMMNAELGWTDDVAVMVLKQEISFGFMYKTYHDNSSLNEMKLDQRILETLEEVNDGSTKAQ